jgi:hypothetical protein
VESVAPSLQRLELELVPTIPGLYGRDRDHAIKLADRRFYSFIGHDHARACPPPLLKPINGAAHRKCRILSLI